MYQNFSTLRFPDGEIFTNCNYTDFIWNKNKLMWICDWDPENGFEAKVLYQIGHILVCEFI